MTIFRGDQCARFCDSLPMCVPVYRRLIWRGISVFAPNWVWQFNCTLSMSIFVDLAYHAGVNLMSAHVWSKANLVRLQKAVLWAHCHVIREGLNGHCPACGREGLLALSRVPRGAIKRHLPVAGRV